MLREWVARVRGTIVGNRRDAELEEELRLHVELATEDERRRAASPEQAGRVARLKAGGVAQTMEALRDQRGLPVVDTLVQDVRYALRACCHNRGFTATVVLSLSLGIGLNSAIFSTLNALMLRVLPVSRPEQLVLLRPASAGPRAIPQFSFPQFTDLRAATPSSDGLAAMSRVARMFATLDGDGSRQTTALQLISGEYFPVLGLTPALGRLLGPEDNQTLGGHPVAVISDAFWRRRFAGASDVVGRGLTVNGTHLTIVGVAPPGFSGVWLEAPVDLWVPLVMQANVKYPQNYYNNNGDHTLPFTPQKEIRWLDIIGRAAAGVRALQTPLGAVFQQSVQAEAETIGDATVRRLFLQQTLTFVPFAQGLSNLRGQFAPPLYVLLGMAALILALACANTANLLLARAEARRREIAVRLSIGASRGRVIRQLLTESIVLRAGRRGHRPAVRRLGGEHAGADGARHDRSVAVLGHARCTRPGIYAAGGDPHRPALWPRAGLPSHACRARERAQDVRHARPVPNERAEKLLVVAQEWRSRSSSWSPRVCLSTRFGTI